jgi:anti-sigma factor (TIGR02949 family)
VDCREVEKFLQVYVDGELDQEDGRLLEEHLHVCPGCRTKADFERRFRTALRARIPRPAAPAMLRAQIVEAMGEVREQRAFPWRWVLSSVPAAAALVAVITFTWTTTTGFTPMVDEAVLQHSSEPPVEVNSSDEGEVESWFRKKVDFHVALPRFEQQRVNLVGARISNLAQRKAALVRYQSGPHSFSLFVVTDPGGELSGRQCQKVRTNEFCLTELKGYTVVLWRSRGLAYSLVGDFSPQQMMEVVSSDPTF